MEIYFKQYFVFFLYIIWYSVRFLNQDYLIEIKKSSKFLLWNIIFTPTKHLKTVLDLFQHVLNSLSKKSTKV